MAEPLHEQPVDSAREHVTDGSQCWCEWWFKKLCQQCNGADCWNCSDGFVRCDLQAEADIVVHVDEVRSGFKL